MRGTNTNTGYFANNDTNTKPVMPSNVTNISPPNLSSNSTSHTNSRPTDGPVTNANANTKKH